MTEILLNSLDFFCQPKMIEIHFFILLAISTSAAESLESDIQ